MSRGEAVLKTEGSIVVPGNHDGVHLGHRALLAEARKIATARGLDVVALTFDPHPLRLLKPELAPPSITSMERRVQLLKHFGADSVSVIRFNEEFAALSAEDFIEDHLKTRLQARAVIAGSDFRFGKNRTGSVDVLREHGLDVINVAEVEVAASRVSSSLVRRALADGRVADAAAMLGRLHDLEGLVVDGHKRGRTIGFPTANLAEGAHGSFGMVPKDGVYAVFGRVLDDQSRVLMPGVANIGLRPTVGAGRSIEAHFLDFEGDLYGKVVRIGFVERLRDEQKFDGLPSLVAQIRLDAERARACTNHPDARCTWI